LVLSLGAGGLSFFEGGWDLGGKVDNLRGRFLGAVFLGGGKLGRIVKGESNERLSGGMEKGLVFYPFFKSKNQKIKKSKNQKNKKIKK